MVRQFNTMDRRGGRGGFPMRGTFNFRGRARGRGVPFGTRGSLTGRLGVKPPSFIPNPGRGRVAGRGMAIRPPRPSINESHPSSLMQGGMSPCTEARQPLLQSTELDFNLSLGPPQRRGRGLHGMPPRFFPPPPRPHAGPAFARGGPYPPFPPDPFFRAPMRMAPPRGRGGPFMGMRPPMMPPRPIRPPFPATKPSIRGRLTFMKGTKSSNFQKNTKPMKEKPKVKSETTSSSELELNKPWVTEAIKNEIVKKHKLHLKAKRSKSKEDWEIFKEHRNRVTTMLREAKLEYIGAHPEEDVEKILAEVGNSDSGSVNEAIDELIKAYDESSDHLENQVENADQTNEEDASKDDTDLDLNVDNPNEENDPEILKYEAS